MALLTHLLPSSLRFLNSNSYTRFYQFDGVVFNFTSINELQYSMWSEILNISILHVYILAFEMAWETCVFAWELSISKISRKNKQTKEAFFLQIIIIPHYVLLVCDVLKIPNLILVIHIFHLPYILMGRAWALKSERPVFKSSSTTH